MAKQIGDVGHGYIECAMFPPFEILGDREETLRVLHETGRQLAAEAAATEARLNDEKYVPINTIHGVGHVASRFIH